MFDWLWQLLGAILAVLASWAGIYAVYIRRKYAREYTQRQIGQDDLIQRSQEQLETTRRRYAHQAPVDPSKRTDFEDHHG